MKKLLVVALGIAVAIFATNLAAKKLREAMDVAELERMAKQTRDSGS